MLNNTFFQLIAVSTNDTVIQIGAAESIAGIGLIVLSIGIAWGTLKTKVGEIDKDVDEIKKDTKSFSKDIATIKAVVLREAQDDYAVAHSPRRLTPKGKNVLIKSGIKAVIDANKDKILTLAIDKNPKTAYDAEICVLEVVSSFIKSDEPLLNTIKEKTFKLGEDLNIVLFVGGIYFRDYALPKLGFEIGDVDKQ